MAPADASNTSSGNDAAAMTDDNSQAHAAASLQRNDSVSSAGFYFQGVQFAPDGDGDGDDSSRLLDDGQRDPFDDGDVGSRRGAGEWPPLRRRRSSIGARLAALTEIGGVNSIRSFTRSWQRAAGFTEVIPQPPSFVFAADQEPIFGAPNSEAYGRSFVDEEAVGTPLTSDNTLPSAAPSEPGGSNLATDQQDGLDDAENAEHKSLLGSSGLTRAFRAGSTSSIFGYPPHLASAAVGGAGLLGTSPVIGSYGSPGSYRSYRSYPYGSVSSAAGLTYDTMTGRRGSGLASGSMTQAGSLWRRQQQHQHQHQHQHQPGPEVEEVEAIGEDVGLIATLDERPAILVKEVEEDGKIILTVEGQSTLPQTIFNSINVLIGVGLLSLPMGIRYAGWICGMTTLLMAAVVTAYTARLLAKCMDLDPVVITFSDLAFISFGPRARVMTSLLFTVELMAACVALVVLFADSLGLLFPGLLTALEWKALCCVIMIPLNFLPMRLLSVTSIIGIVCCFSIVSIVVIDGFTKKTSPGSLLQPAATYMFPANWLTLPLSFGLLMSPWGGHSVFPNIYRDMRHPAKYAKAVKVTFSFTYFLDVTTAVVGLLMFGDDVMDEITANILSTSGYPRALTLLLCVMIAIIPLTKIPLNARPIITTIEVLAGTHQQVAADAPGQVGRTIVKVAIRVLTILSFFAISVVFPAFDSIMAFMGSALCFTICVTLPILFHLKLFGNSLSGRDKVLQYAMLSLSIVLSVVGTVWSFLPKSLLGVE
ncbi:vacuolar amino acid transporter 1 [Grosmannia clavigera kw1407]|uniref:Vacuolar amino acid transporter 1 n=1 Tax=Grosmannia clavigera (strain kw1407 / UAMH 11150) TaxID=655863 RepID=F0XPN9_GROCL|nr:vacuolar amino acid transporter 1 [Grosmannia clavigera kw1407]EFX00035.1 vacuolar amino acid transporter 1 [Grosmannia clavigera kw1407]